MPFPELGRHEAPMTLLREPERVPVGDIHVAPGPVPHRDDVFLDLARRAISGLVDVYYAAVPLSLIRPFDAQYDPTAHPAGEAATRAVMTEWAAGKFVRAWVYPAADAYILSDDYIVLAAAKRGQPGFLPCWALGEPTVPGAVDIQGPIKVDSVARLLGLRSVK